MGKMNIALLRKEMHPIPDHFSISPYELLGKDNHEMADNSQTSEQSRFT